MFGRRRHEEEYRQFIRELLLRFDRSAAEARAEFRAHREESRKYFEALDARAEEAKRRLDELLEESRAQREGFWRLLDRLDNGGTAPAG